MDFHAGNEAESQGSFWAILLSFARHGRVCMELDDNDIQRANERGRRLQSSHPRAISARYDRRLGQIVIRLDSKLDIAFSPVDAEGLEGARPDQLEPIEISPSGFGIHFPKLDADLYLPALLEGFLGSKKWMAARWTAAQMGASGGQSRSQAKVTAARTNGSLGGRPRKHDAAPAARRKRAAVKP
jgi:hypothetical protein